MKTFSARVLKCAENGETYDVILDRTAFYPEGGGKPSDTGVLNFANVLDVQEHDGVITHTTDRPLEVGTRVMGGVNWARRFALMQQHTGEHIVSGVANRLFGVDNVGFHMGIRAITVDWNGEINENQLAVIQNIANEAVYRDITVKDFCPSAEELKKLSYRSKKELKGTVRIIEIPGYDVCACCGTHVAHTGEIGAVKLISAQRYKGGTRISMVCGAQAMADYDEKQRGVSDVSVLLSSKPEEIGANVKHLLDENSQLKQETASLRNRIFDLEIQALPENSGNTCLFEQNLTPDDLRVFVLKLAGRCGGAAAIFSGTDEAGYRYAVSVPGGDTGMFAKKLNTEFNGRGGGSKELAQGALKGNRCSIEKFVSTYTI